ncbi:MAG: hypothetical protein JST59_02515 [Actinobacteria bacterium]|nr:hypothetical protein [Actinomycetota bacterium]
MVECGFLRILNSNIILDKLCYRLFYFRLLRQFVTHCRQEHINNLELLADGIIDIIVDHGLGSHDLTTVSEALEILQIVLQRKGDLRENQIAARLARNPDFMELLEHLTYSNEAEVYGMATRIK